MNKRKILIITAILAVATTIIGYVYISNIKKEAIKEAEIERVQLVTVANNVLPHVELSEDMLEMKEYPKEVAPASAVASFEDVVGKKTKSDLLAGEPILTERMVDDETDSELSYRIPESMRAVTIPNTEVSGVAGYIVSGDFVDMMIAYSEEEEAEGEEEASSTITQVYTQMQNIEVLMTGPNKIQTQVDQETGVSVPSSLTLLVSPQQAEVIAYANRMGTIQLTLRNPSDKEEESLEGYGDTNFEDWKER